MKKIFLLLVLTLSFLGNAQVNELSINQSLNKIYKKYNDSCKIKADFYLKKFKSKYKNSKLSLRELLEKDEDYNDAFLKYTKEISRFDDLKIIDLENLILEVEEIHPISGKKMVGSLKEGKTIEDLKSSPMYKNLDIILISKEEFNKIEEEFIRVSSPIIRKEVANSFPVDLLEDNDGETLRTSLSFLMDVDGTLKRVKTSGENKEFNLLGTLTLYSLKKKFLPIHYNGEDVVTAFRLPLTINFE